MTEQQPEQTPYSGLATVDELQDYMKTSFSASERRTAAMILLGIQQEFENHINRPVEPVQMRELLTSDLNGYLNPSITPILKVISVVTVEKNVDPFLTNEFTGLVPPIFARDPLVDPDNGRMLDHLYPTVGDPLVVGNGIYTNQPSTVYAVEYVAGYNGYMDVALKLDFIRVASREMSKNHSKAVNLRGGDAQAANEPDPRERGWTPEELAGWDRLRRRTVA